MQMGLFHPSSGEGMGVQEIAEELRRRREEQGKSLEDAQVATKIRLRYLQALEAAEPEQIPGEVYVKGFLRSYGDYLGLDGWALVERYKAGRRAAAGEAEADSQRPEPAEEDGRVPRIAPRAYALFHRPRRGGQQPASGGFDLALRVVVLFTALVVGFTVWALSQGPARQGRLPAGAGAGTSSGDGAARTPANPAGADGSGQPAVTPDTAPTPAGTDQGSGGAEPAAPAVTVETTRDGRSVSYLVKGAEALRVEADLSGDCWVRVMADGQEVYSATLHQGDRQAWEARQRMEIQAGLPVNLRLTVNGVAVDPVDSTEPVNISFQTGS